MSHFDWPEYIGVWQDNYESLADEFERLRKAGPKWSRSQFKRMAHIEMHLDRGDIICNCYTLKSVR